MYHRHSMMSLHSTHLVSTYPLPSRQRSAHPTPNYCNSRGNRHTSLCQYLRRYQTSVLVCEPVTIRTKVLKWVRYKHQHSGRDTNIVSQCLYSTREPRFVRLKSAIDISFLGQPAVVDTDVLIADILVAVCGHPVSRLLD